MIILIRRRIDPVAVIIQHPLTLVEVTHLGPLGAIPIPYHRHLTQAITAEAVEPIYGRPIERSIAIDVQRPKAITVKANLSAPIAIPISHQRNIAWPRSAEPIKLIPARYPVVYSISVVIQNLETVQVIANFRMAVPVAIFCYCDGPRLARKCKYFVTGVELPVPVGIERPDWVSCLEKADIVLAQVS